MARRKTTIDDSTWPEVLRINNYATFMGCLFKGVRGLGFLVFTWTTVVLLGGFVSTLQKKDFWCLTVIMLVQTITWKKADEVGNSLEGSLASALGGQVLMTSQRIKEQPTKRMVVALIICVVQVLVVSIVLFPLAVLHLYGLYVSTGISIWRLIQHDYSNPDGGANLNSALNVLYSLAVAQGLVHFYKIIYHFEAGTRLVQVVANHYSLDEDLVLDYLAKIMAGCMKDPLFARRRNLNLVRYAADLLMESKSRYGYISGVLILGQIRSSKQRDLLRQLLFESASFSQVLQQLVETFSPTSPYSKDIMVRAAKIVAIVAGKIRVEQFPAQGVMIQCISSLLDTFEEKKYEQDYPDNDKITIQAAADSKIQGYKSLVVEGLRILQGLAINEENCRIITSTEGLLSKAMAHLVSDKFHRDNHDEWSRIAVESLEFMNQLISTLGLGGTQTTKLTSEISGNSQATIFRTLECHKCHVLLKRQAAQVLLHLSPDTTVMPYGIGSSSITLVWILLDIFLLPDDRIRGSTHLANKNSDIAILAGQRMQAMMTSTKMEASGTSVLESVVGDVIGSLARTVAGFENNAYRIQAATILKRLCEHYTKDDDNLKKLKKAVASVMEEVLITIVHWPTTEEMHAATEAHSGGNVLLAEGLDLEQGGVPLPHEDNGEESSSTHHEQKGEQHQGIQLQQALIDLCSGIYTEWIDEKKDRELTRQLNEIAAKISSGQRMPDKTFKSLVQEAEEKLWGEERASRLAAALYVPAANFLSETET